MLLRWSRRPATALMLICWHCLPWLSDLGDTCLSSEVSHASRAPYEGQRALIRDGISEILLVLGLEPKSVGSQEKVVEPLQVLLHRIRV